MKTNTIHAKKLLLSLFAILLPLLANAHDFEINGIFYNITSSTEVEVTFEGDSYDSYYYEYSGSINIPESVTYIYVEYSVTSIGDCAFRDCSSLTAITIPESVTSIGDEAFYHCGSLTTVTIPEGVTSIGEGVFRNCNSLASIVLPKTIESIDCYAFAGCSALFDVYCYAESIPSTTEAFEDSELYHCRLHVPASAINNYKATAPWIRFGLIIPMAEIEVKKCTTPTISYEDGKIVLTCETEGVEFKTSVVVENDNEYIGAEFNYIPTQTFTAYTTKEGYEDSDEAILTICWVPCDEEHESEETGILTIPSHPVLISTQGGTITLSGLAEGTEVAVYTSTGTEIATTTATAGTATIASNLELGTIAIVKIGEHSVKVVIK